MDRGGQKKKKNVSFETLSPPNPPATPKRKRSVPDKLQAGALTAAEAKLVEERKKRQKAAETAAAEKAAAEREAAAAQRAAAQQAAAVKAAAKREAEAAEKKAAEEAAKAMAAAEKAAARRANQAKQAEKKRKQREEQKAQVRTNRAAAAHATCRCAIAQCSLFVLLRDAQERAEEIKKQRLLEKEQLQAVVVEQDANVKNVVTEVLEATTKPAGTTREEAKTLMGPLPTGPHAGPTSTAELLPGTQLTAIHRRFLWQAIAMIEAAVQAKAAAMKDLAEVFAPASNYNRLRRL